MLVSKNAKICVTPNANAKFALPPTPTPKASRWNIGSVGSPTQNSHFGHVHFMFFVLISFALGGQREPSFQWNMGFRVLSTLISPAMTPRIFCVKTLPSCIDVLLVLFYNLNGGVDIWRAIYM